MSSAGPLESPSQPIDDADLNQRLVERYTEIATLAGGLAHEIKNPLSTIRLNMELLAEDFADTATQRDKRVLAKVQMVQRECLRLQNLLDDFLNFAKLRRLQLAPTDLNAVVNEVLELFSPQAEEHRIDVIRYLDPDLPTVKLDSETFKAALINLVINAEQAMKDKGGQLVVRSWSRGRAVALDLIDTGCGMDDHTRSHIFEAFFSTKPGGSGLGLATARKIIEAHGGGISVESAQGRGTKFTIALPVPARLGASSAASPAADAIDGAIKSEPSINGEVIDVEIAGDPGFDGQSGTNGT